MGMVGLQYLQRLTVCLEEPGVWLHRDEQLVIGKLALRGVGYIVLLVNFRDKGTKEDCGQLKPQG